ncbi:MAG: DUF1080 domain-containing protein [Gemmatimonadaceae bacterium]|nr:DUF1080 domain-containing protein [Gemmatimonadaceae bacterium]
MRFHPALALAAVLAFLLPSASRAQAAPGEWISLQRADAWRGYRSDTLPSGWTFDDATGVLLRGASRRDIITRRQFSDFELEFEWRVSETGNSGVFYRATEGTRVVYENAPEYQILDNVGAPDGRSTLTSAAANYGLDAPVRDVTKPVGEWNHGRIIARGPHVEHWLNGVKVVEYELWTPEWRAKVATTKFAAWPAYGWGTYGHIALQEHPGEVAFRGMRIRELSR